MEDLKLYIERTHDITKNVHQRDPHQSIGLKEKEQSFGYLNKKSKRLIRETKLGYGYFHSSILC